jgi:hypothetical protein
VLQDLGAIVPSLVVCVAFLAGVFFLLRREMAPRRRNSEDDGPAGDMPAAGPISESKDGAHGAASGREEIADRQTGSRSRD